MAVLIVTAPVDGDGRIERGDVEINGGDFGGLLDEDYRQDDEEDDIKNNDESDPFIAEEKLSGGEGGVELHIVILYHKLNWLVVNDFIVSTM